MLMPFSKLELNCVLFYDEMENDIPDATMYIYLYIYIYIYIYIYKQMGRFYAGGNSIFISSIWKLQKVFHSID